MRCFFFILAYTVFMHEKYVDISLDIVKQFKTPLVFDVYVKRSETSYTKIFKQDDILDWDRVMLYESKGISFFYVTKEDYYNYTLYVERLGRELAETTQNIEDFEHVANVVGELIGVVAFELSNSKDIDQRVVNVSKQVVKNSIKILNENHKGMVLLFKNLISRPYFFKHSTMVSILSIIIAKSMKIENELKLEIIALGGLFHDLGKLFLSFDPDQVEFMSPERQLEYERHPEISKKMLDGIPNINQDVLKIVLQHHESPNGKGFPNSLTTLEIFTPAKIVSIANGFAELITKRDYRSAFSTGDAFIEMKKNTGKYDSEILNMFMKNLKKS